MDGGQAVVTRLAVRALVLWTMATAVFIAQISTAGTNLIGWLTLGLVLLLCLGGPLRAVRVVSAIIALALFLVSQIYPIWHPNLLQELGTQVAPTLLAAACIAGAGVLSYIAGSRLTWPTVQAVPALPVPQQLPPAHLSTEREPSTEEASQKRLLSALEKVLQGWEPHTQGNGKSSVDRADDLLAREIARSSRYGRVFSLALLAIDGSVQQGGDGDHLARQVEEVVAGQLRTVDSVVLLGANKLAAILPETPKRGAITMAERVHKMVTSACSVECRIGIAEFPSDADNKTELVEEAEAALDVARLTNAPVAGRQFAV
jgi:GGDEF domain-containing protein